MSERLKIIAIVKLLYHWSAAYYYVLGEKNPSLKTFWRNRRGKVSSWLHLTSNLLEPDTHVLLQGTHSIQRSNISIPEGNWQHCRWDKETAPGHQHCMAAHVCKRSSVVPFTHSGLYHGIRDQEVSEPGKMPLHFRGGCAGETE